MDDERRLSAENEQLQSVFDEMALSDVDWRAVQLVKAHIDALESELARFQKQVQSLQRWR